MKPIYSILTILAGAGYLTSVVLYALTFQDVDPQELPVYWPLTFLLFGIWLAAVLKLRAYVKSRALQRNSPLKPLDAIKLTFDGTPVWLLAITAVSFVFAMASFAVLMVEQPGVVSVIDGKRVLHNHGDILRELDDDGYRHALAIEARRWLGHYLLFFGAATAILFPKTARRTPA